jgi:hypothetical protein
LRGTPTARLRGWFVDYCDVAVDISIRRGIVKFDSPMVKRVILSMAISLGLEKFEVHPGRRVG